MKSPFARRVTVCLALALALTLPFGCDGGGGGGATPQETFEIANKAIKGKDFAGFVNCMTEEAQGMMAGTMAMAGTMMKAMGGMMAGLGGEEAKKKFETASKAMDDVMKKYDVKLDPTKLGGMMSGGKEPDPKMLAQVVASVKDKAGFAAEMMKAMEGMGEKKDGPVESFDGTLENVEIDGDKATGTVKNNKGKTTKLEFKKVGGQWLIDNFME